MAYTVARAESSGWIRPADLTQRLMAANIRFATLARNPQISAALPPSQLISLERATGATVGDVSALCLFTALEIAEREDRAVEFIVSAVGGSNIETWLPAPSANALGLIDDDHRAFFADPHGLASSWQRNVETILDQLPAAIGPSSAISVPGRWEDQGHGGLDGVVWLETNFILEAKDTAGPALLSLGLVDDWDTTFVNGCRVGASFSWAIPRSYSVPQDCLRSGLNTLRVRIADSGGSGGIVGGPDHVFIAPATRASMISLAGEWRLSAVGPLPDLPVQPGNDRTTPSVLFNGMVAPLANEEFDGVIWYQGEQNAYAGDTPNVYARKLSTLVAAWRELFSAPELQFYIVQLPEFDPGVRAGPYAFGHIRLGQSHVADDDPNVTLVPALGLGSVGDIHPPDKTVLASRVADAVLGDRRAPENCRLVNLRDHETPAALTLERCDAALGTCNLVAQSATTVQELAKFADLDDARSLVIGRANVPGYWLSCRTGALSAQPLISLNN